MAGEVEELGIEVDRVAAAPQHDAPQVVVPELAGHPLPGLEGVDMAMQEVAHGRTEVEAQEDAPRVAEHHHEAHQRALRAPDPDLAEVSPIDLGLLAGKGLQAQIGLGHGLGPEGGDHMTEVVGAARIAAFAHHLIETAGRQRRPGRQRLDDERHVGIDHRRPRRDCVPGLARIAERPLDGVAMHAELACDRADLPLLDVVEPQDLRAGLLVDSHPHSSRAGCRTGRRPG